MSQDPWVFGVDQLIALTGLLGALVAFLVGLRQYRRAQAWKRAEWVAAEVASFLSTPDVVNALAMIDWWGRYILLFPLHPDPEQRQVKVDDPLVTAALVHHSKSAGFNRAQARIRDCFDCLLDGLERFENFIEVGLIDVEDVRPYLSYWIERISGRHPDSRDQARLQQLWCYVDAYEFKGVQRLVARFGSDPGFSCDQSDGE